jgi:hypothetical protein
LLGFTEKSIDSGSNFLELEIWAMDPSQGFLEKNEANTQRD